jgi:hypothetical protein
MLTDAFYTLPTDVQAKIVAYNALTPEQREDRYEDALQRQMEDSWDEYEPDYDDCDEEDDYADSGDWGYTELDGLRDDIDDLRIATKARDSKIAIFEAQIRALAGGTCTAVVVHNGIYEPTFALSMAVAHQTDMQMAEYYASRDLTEMEE